MYPWTGFFNERTIVRLEDLGVSLFRLNLSHTKIDDISQAISYVKTITDVPLCLDTEGAQIRNGSIKNGSVFIIIYVRIIIIRISKKIFIASKNIYR